MIRSIFMWVINKVFQVLGLGFGVVYGTWMSIRSMFSKCTLRKLVANGGGSMRSLPDKDFDWESTDNEKIANGTFRIAYSLQSKTKRGLQYVIKVPRRDREQESAAVANRVHAYASVSARLFTEYLRQKFPDCKWSVRFADEWTMTIKKEHVIGTGFLQTVKKFFTGKDDTYPLVAGDTVTIEERLKGSYTKYNNNGGWVDKSFTGKHLHPIMQAFSHWTAAVTKGDMLLICDLQGVCDEDNHEYLLTDAAFHSQRTILCGPFSYQEFGQADWGPSGIQRFFASHKCNEYCQDLGSAPKITESRLSTAAPGNTYNAKTVRK